MKKDGTQRQLFLVLIWFLILGKEISYSCKSIFKNIATFLIRVMRRSGLVLPWVRMDSKLFFALYTLYDTLLVFVVFYQFIFASGSIMRIGNFQDMCTLGIVIAVLATGVMISIFYILYQQRLEKFTNNWNDLNRRILNSDPYLAEYFQGLYLGISKNNEVFAKRILFIAFWTPFMYCSPVPIIDVIRGSYRTNLPLPILYPYDDHQPGTYEVTFCLHVLGLLISVMKKIGNDCFFLGLFKIHSVYLRYLSESIKAAQKKFANNDWFIRSKQIELIKLHAEIIRNAVELVSIYTPIIVIYYGNLIIIVVFGLFTQIKNDRDNVVQGFGVGGFCLINIFQLYMMCSSAEELAAEAEQVALAIYNIPWYRMCRSNANMLRLMLLMARNPVKVTAFRAPTFLLNKETFIGFIVNTITALMTFSKMNDRRQSQYSPHTVYDSL